MPPANDKSVTQSHSTQVTDDYGREGFDLPELREFLNPGFWYRWTLEFLEGWLFSRNYNRLLIGIPFLIVAVGGSAYIWWLRSAPKDEIINRYEEAVVTAMQDDRPKDAELLLRSLLQQRPRDVRYRYQLAMYLIDQDRLQAAMGHIQQMTLLDRRGFVPARLWLVTQASQPEPFIPLSDDMILAQLLKAIEEDFNSAEAHQLISDVYARKGLLRDAEEHLMVAAESKPELALNIAKIQTQIGRSQEQINSYLDRASEAFQSRRLANPLDTTARIGWAEVMLLKNQVAEAESVLREGIELQDSEELRMALSGLYTGMAIRRLQESVLNRDLATKLTTKAIEIHAANPAVTQLTIRLIETGAKFSEADLKPLVTIWTEKANAPKSTEQTQLILVQLLASSNRADEAIAMMQTLAEKNPNLRSMLARLYSISGQQANADSLLGQLIADYKTEAEEQPDDIKALLRYAQALMQATQYSDARTILRPWIDRELDDESRNQIRSAFVAATLAHYDSITDQSAPTEDQPSKLDLLKDVIKLDLTNTPFIQRLARLSCSSDPNAPDADELLIKVIAQGTVNAKLYNYVGTCALEGNQFVKARTYLEQARELTPNNPMVLNNLALALIRESADNAEQALQRSEEALALLPQNPDVLSTRAEVLVAQQEWEAARADLEAALPQRPQSRNTRQLLVKVYDALNEPAIADEHRRILSELE